MDRKTSKTPGEKLHVEVPRSILKWGETPHSSKAKENVLSVDPKSVKFMKSKYVEQQRLRTKLNAWLESKGKTPSRCHHLICFDAELSAKRKGDSGKQEELLRKEVNNQARKKLFVNGKASDCSKKTSLSRKHIERRSLVKTEKTPTSRKSVDFKAFSDKTNSCLKSPLPSSSKKSEGDDHHQNKTNPESPFSPVLGHDSRITDEQIREHLLSMLQECVTLLRAGCPSDTILQWLHNMELHIPQTQTCASFYACKAEVFASNPVKMLEVFCQGVENKAEPSQALSEAMQRLLTPHLSSQEDPSHLAMHSSIPLSYTPDADKGVGQVDETPSSVYEISNTVLSPACQVDHVYLNGHLESAKSKTPVNRKRDHPSSSMDRRRSAKRTPITNTNVPECSPQLGSTIKYTVSSVTSLKNHSPESVPKSALTPVRRSIRLSGRHSTPRGMREIDSMRELTLGEAETTIFCTNPALQDD